MDALDFVKEALIDLEALERCLSQFNAYYFEVRRRQKEESLKR